MSQFFLQHRGDLIPFGHDVIQQHIVLVGRLKRLLEQFIAFGIDAHGFVGIDIEAGIDRGFDIVDFFAVIARTA